MTSATRMSPAADGTPITHTRHQRHVVSGDGGGFVRRSNLNTAYCSKRLTAIEKQRYRLTLTGLVELTYIRGDFVSTE